MVNKSLQIIHLLAEFSNISPIIKGLAFNSTIKEFRVDQSVRESAIKLADYALARKKIVFFPINLNHLLYIFLNWLKVLW